VTLTGRKRLTVVALGANMSGSIDDLELVLKTDCERLVNEMGVEGEGSYVQRRGMKTRTKGRILETEKVKTIAKAYGT
jgi:hypothetical protein